MSCGIAQWANSNGVITGGGQSAPYTSQREISADLPGIERQGKKRNRAEKNEDRKSGNRKWKGEKLHNEERTFFFFSLFKTTEICFWSTKMGIFYRKKHITPAKKQEK